MTEEAVKLVILLSLIAIAIFALYKAEKIKKELPPADTEVGPIMGFVMVAGYGAVTLARTAAALLTIGALFLWFVWQV